MKRRILAIAIATLGGALAGCVSTGRDQSLIGTLEVYGENAYRNKQPVGSGARVNDGDTISTGDDTSMRLNLVDGASSSSTRTPTRSSCARPRAS